MVDGGGLRCCLDAAVKEQALRRLGKAKMEYDKKIASFGKLKRIGEYLGAHIKVEHICLEHGFKDFIWPTDAKRGVGLECCRIATAKQNARERTPMPK